MKCNRCGKEAKEGKEIGDHCGQLYKNDTMFCSGKIIEGKAIPRSEFWSYQLILAIEKEQRLIFNNQPLYGKP